MQLHAPAHWRTVDCISDLHLDTPGSATYGALEHYLAQSPAQALLVLGDLFEIWIGDDALGDAQGIGTCVARLLANAARRMDVFIMCGNRDFLMGPQLLQACGAHALPDPTVLHFGGQRLLLTHGDAQCLADTDYQKFRSTVRSPAWQNDFLAKPLPERQVLAQAMRAQSEANKAMQKSSAQPWIDLDTDACLQDLHTHGAQHMIHGHTHQPAQHALDDRHSRWVVSDWDMQATAPRAEVLRLALGKPDSASPLHMERLSVVGGPD